MKYWNVVFTDEAYKDIEALDISIKRQVDKAIRKVSQNPLPKDEGGYGTPLGNKGGRNLTGLCRIKLKNTGIRVIYKLYRDGESMRIIVIAARADDEVYRIAALRNK